MTASFVTSVGGALGFVVCGNPAPQGSKAFMGLTPNGKPKMRESSKNVRPWRQDVRFAALEAMKEVNWQKLDEPIAIRFDFYLRRPKKPKFDRPATSPDGDKLQRSTLDALASAGVFSDDARIVSYRVELWFEDEMNPPGATIVVAAARSVAA